MSKRRGRRAAIIGAVVGVAVVAAVLYAVRRPLLESWYLWQLESDDPEAVEAAAKGLAEVGSVRSIPALLTLAHRTDYLGWDTLTLGGISQQWSWGLGLFCKASLSCEDATRVEENCVKLDSPGHTRCAAADSCRSLRRAVTSYANRLLSKGAYPTLSRIVSRDRVGAARVLRSELRSESWERRRDAAYLLEVSGAFDSSTRDALSSMVEDEQAFVAIAAHQALETMDDRESDAYDCVLFKLDPPPSPRE